MLKNSLKILLLIIGALAATIAIAEMACRAAGIRPDKEFHEKNLVTVKPTPLLVKDSLLSWRLNAGEHTICIDDTPWFSCSINQEGDRVLPPLNGKDSNDLRINFYGCSFTFGLSVPDTCHYPLYFQQQMAANGYPCVVRNRGVPGYGLVQMFLSLKNDVIQDKKPDMAVFNYATFQDFRTELSRLYCEELNYSFFNEFSSVKKDEVVPFPYPEASGDSMVIVYTTLNELPHFFPMREHSSLVNLLNTRYSEYVDRKNEAQLHALSVKVALALVRYCNQHQIKLVFTGFDKPSAQLLQQLSSAGEVHTLLFKTDMLQDGYNCAPKDQGHPNALAHRQYAQELYEFMAQEKLLPVKQE